MARALKRFLKIIQARIGIKIDQQAGTTQFGFRPWSGTREAIFCFKSLAEKFFDVGQVNLQMLHMRPTKSTIFS